MSDTHVRKRPLPKPDDPLVAAFWSHVYGGELRFQRCDDCGVWRHLPRLVCAECDSDRWTWAPSSGRGRVHSWTVTHQRLFKSFPEEVPYAVLVVELEEGVRMVSGLRDLGPSALAIDLPVEVVFEDVGEGKKLAFFRPREETH